MRRRFVRQQEAPAAREQFSIAVTGLGRDAGTTLVSTSLAIFYAEKGESVTFTECCVPGRSCSLLCDAVAMVMTYVVIKSIFSSLRGVAVGWNKLKRLGSVKHSRNIRRHHKRADY